MVRLATSVEAYAVLLQVPELDRYVSLEDFNIKLAEGSLVLVAEIEGEAAGFKVGYPLSENTFYSWLGGVLPGYRQQGVA
ncbi:MAG: GNAT family N-acetyltransferase, partial [Pseudomonadota bacterium]